MNRVGAYRVSIQLNLAFTSLPRDQTGQAVNLLMGTPCLRQPHIHVTDQETWTLLQEGEDVNPNAATLQNQVASQFFGRRVSAGMAERAVKASSLIGEMMDAGVIDCEATAKLQFSDEAAKNATSNNPNVVLAPTKDGVPTFDAKAHERHDKNKRKNRVRGIRAAEYVIQNSPVDSEECLKAKKLLSIHEAPGDFKWGSPESKRKTNAMLGIRIVN